MENPIKMDDLGGKPPILGNLNVSFRWFFEVFLVHLDTRLKVESLELIYGERDWMDVRHGNKVAEVPEPSVATVVQLLMDAGPTRETRWWFQTFFIFIPTWGNDPI